MLILSEKNIALNCYAQTKEDALDVIYKGLLENQNVSIGFKAKMLAREKQFSTYLMNGIAIPHANREGQNFVKKTGIFIGQFKHGVNWGEGNNAYLVIGIAANSEEHLTLLRHLTHLLKNQEKIQQLITTDNAKDFLEIFNLSNSPTNNTHSQISPTLLNTAQTETTVTIYNQHGLHARPAAILARLANQFCSDIYVCRKDGKNKWVNSKSLISLLNLSIQYQEQLKFMAQGEDAKQAIAAIEQSIAEGLGEPR